MTIFRYPYRSPVPGSGSTGEGTTEAIDYICIKRNRRVYKDPGGKSYYSNRKLKDSDNLAKTNDPDTVYLAMPPQLATAYQAGYQKVDVGVLGMGALEMFANNDANNQAEALQKASRGILTEFTSSGVANVINGASGMLGLAGQLSPNVIQAMTQGRVFNPFSEQIFNSMGFRTHSFNFKLAARNAREAQEIKSIIKYLKVGMAPKITTGDFNSALESGNQSGKTKAWGELITGQKDIADGIDEVTDVSKLLYSDRGAGRRFFQTPDHYDLKFVRAEDGRLVWQGNSSDNATRGMHFRIHPSYCTGVSVNYTPDGQYTSFKQFDGSMVQVPAVNLGLSFVETRLIDKNDMENGF